MVPISIKRIFKVPIDGEKEAPPRGDDSVRSSQQQAEDKREASASKVVASLPREDGVQSSQQQAEDARDSQAEDTRDSHAESVPPPPPTANPSVVDASERSERGENDCPLCLSPLHPYDHSHPLQCPSSHCNFNCCMECLEHMIESTKDEPIEASDGNTFKVFLHCPNCRSNLGPSIRDTVLLRKVEKYMHLETNKQKVAEDLKLPASELRLKDALERDVGVASAVEGARHREDDFFGRTESEEQSFGYLDSYLGKKDSCEKTNSIWSFDSEEGVEADLSGPHKSYIFRHHGNGSDATDEPRKLTEVQADPTLLCGLDAFMTDQEQQFITAQFTSGDAGRIAAATEMMHCIAALSRQDMKPSLKRMKSCHKRTPSMKRSMLESINEVIREANEARRLEEEREARQAAGEIATAAKALQFVAISEEKRKKKREVDMEVKRQMEYMKLHPLPLRMPKYAELTSNKAESSGLSFLDDMWDGTGEHDGPHNTTCFVLWSYLLTICCLSSKLFVHTFQSWMLIPRLM